MGRGVEGGRRHLIPAHFLLLPPANKCNRKNALDPNLLEFVRTLWGYESKGPREMFSDQ